MFGALGFFCGLGLGFVFNETGKKKLEVAQLITPSYQSKQAPGRRAASPSLVFLVTQVRSCSLALTGSVQVALIYPRAEPVCVKFLSPSNSALTLAITDLTILFRFSLVLKKCHAEAHCS